MTTQLMNVYPNRGFLFGDIILYKFLISSESLESASFIGSIKKAWRNFVDELTVDNLVVDFEAIVLSILFSLGERAVGNKIEELIAPTVERRTIRESGRQAVIEVVPTPKYLAARAVSCLTARAIFYPLQTTLIRLLTREVTFTGVPRLFTSGTSFKDLYSGFSVNMAWSCGYTLACSLVQYGAYQGTTDGGEVTGAAAVAGGALLHLGLVPLRIKALFDRAGLPYQFVWVPTFYRFAAAAGINALGN